MRLNCDAHLGVNTAQERDVSTFPPGGGMRHRGGAQNAPAGWTPPRRVALPRAPRLCACNPPEGPSMCVQLSQWSPAPPLKEAVALQKRMITPSLSPHFLRQLQLEVSRSIQVSRSPGCCFHTKWVARCAEQARNTSTTSCENSNQGCD